eukprot:CAMPEP_0167750966 /NCGR_PEP_ID=MMETSP0110_2-20121227/6291_1 /TAXON_ID=629695 /ORGANISM="Gymnochlora sp., Strain CCMP2014" /LENGTH=533 /DNA_ID=CAMNT_0007636359 /DNA_START=49 /DNA_END=1650 /DNA_ORIENTATION=+
MAHRFADFSSFQAQPMRAKRANAARLNNLCQRLKKKLERRWNGADDEMPRKAQRKTWDQCSNSSRWSVDDRIVVFQEAANEFLRDTKVWQLVPIITRVVVVDSKLTIQQVIDALVHENQENAAPVWNSQNERFTGVVTWQSLINALVASESTLNQFLSTPIGQIKLDSMQKVHPTHPLKEVIQKCMQTAGPCTFCIVGATYNGGLETSDILNVFTRRRILKFLFGQLSSHTAAAFRTSTVSTKGIKGDTKSSRSSVSSMEAIISSQTNSSSGGGASALKRNLFDEILMFTVEQLSIAQTHSVEIVRGGVTLKHVLKTLVMKSLPRVVVLDSDGRAVEMYSRSDIRILSDEVLAALDQDIVQAAKSHRRLCTFCTKQDTLQSIMFKMATGAATSEALVCVNSEGRFEGLVSFTSLFGILESKQGASAKSISSSSVREVTMTDAKRGDNGPQAEISMIDAKRKVFDSKESEDQLDATTGLERNKVVMTTAKVATEEAEVSMIDVDEGRRRVEESKEQNEAARAEEDNAMQTESHE